MTTFDLTILPIHRQNGQEFSDLPGLLADAAPRKAARGREKDSLVLYLVLGGNAEFSTGDVKQLTRNASNFFFQTPGSLTSAMRKTVENINSVLLERNLASSGRGQYTLGLLVLAVVRENQCTLSLSGPAHVVWVGEGQQRHIYDTALSGKGLGSSQSVQTYLSQVEFQSNDLIALCGRFPKEWEADLLNSRPSASMDATYRKLTFTKGDLNAVLVQPQNGKGIITVLRPEVNASQPTPPTPAPVSNSPITPEAISESSYEPEPFQTHHLNSDAIPLEEELTDEAFIDENETIDDKPIISEDELDALADLGVHMLQPSAYAIPPKPEIIYPAEEFSRSTTPATAPSPTGPRSFPASIPRAKPVDTQPITDISDEEENDLEEIAPVVEAAMPRSALPGFLKSTKPETPGAHADATKMMAKAVVGGIQTGRRVGSQLSDFFRNFLPKLLPGNDPEQLFVMPSYVFVSMAVIIPVLVAVVSWVIYNKYGLSQTYYELYEKALVANGQATSETDPARQRDAYDRVLFYLDQAEEYRQTDETKFLRNDTQSKLDNLMGVIRLEFIPAFTNGLGSSVQISRMAASESDLYMLDAERGNVLHATFTGRTLDIDGAFNCQPGTYGGYQIGTIVDILALPKINAVGATVLGIDTAGNLLYCAPGQIPQAVPLPPLPNTNWGRITSFVLDNERLYILDSEARAVWVFNGRDSTFLDPPYFFFGNQVPAVETAIDLAVTGDDLYLLHADGHLSTCVYSRIGEVPTRCVDPAPRIDNFASHQGIDIFAEAHITQMSLTNPPNSVVLLLDSSTNSVFRLSPRSLELQNQVTGFAGRGSPFQPGSAGAMTISPNYVLYLAIGNQVYFATNLP